MKFLDICSGIGGFRAGFEKSGHECVGFVEFNENAVRSYQAIHNTEGEFYHNDITTVRTEDLPSADGWTFGFPCQDISIGGCKVGFNGSRSSIYLDIIKLITDRAVSDRPRWLFIENVKHLLSIDDGWLFKTVLSELEQAGYDVEWEVLNSKDFGVPQNRERVYLVGYLRGECRRGILPFARGGGETSLALGQSKVKVDLVSNIHDSEDAHYRSQAGRIYCASGLSPTLTCSCEDLVMIKLPDGTKRVRRLTPRECFRLQGFTDEQFDRVSKVNSKTQLYKQAGNAVTVNITSEIGKRWKELSEVSQFEWM